MPCEPYCPPSYTSHEYWTNLTYHSAGNTGWSTCYMTNSGLSKWHNEWVTVYRRDRIRVTVTCPNSPTCDGCYETEQALYTQYVYFYCYYETAWQCGSGYMPCCSNLCNVYSWTLCEDGFPCY